ncbi:MAG TPA: TolC family protein, partial [Oxalobacteraceae bacterium]|nr:TolC family protein [Oxalobacteraceae bacterium]
MQSKGTIMMELRLTLVAVLTTCLASCATYKPLPLQSTPRFPVDVPHHLALSARMPLPELASHRFDPSDGLDMTEAAMLAVANNPQLKVSRDEAGIAQAQSFAAGLLPDPQLSLARDFPTNGTVGNTSAFNLGLNYDVNALLTRSASTNAARAAQRQVDLNLLWHEWQVVSQVRLLFVRNLGQQQLLAVLQNERALLDSRYRHTQRALAQGNLTLDTANADLAALQTTDTAINDLARQIVTNRHDLNALLGLAPGMKIRLVGDAQLPAIDEAGLKSAMNNIGVRRPDLLALQAGYESQEQRFRQTILAQFPALNVGLTRARDTSGLYTQGFGITLSLPIFNRNRGNIAIEQTTRLRLHDEYQMRINTAFADIAKILADQKLLEKQLKNVQSGEGALAHAAANAQTAFDAGNIDSLAYNNLRTAWLAKQREAITLKQTLLEQRVALLTLIGGELPTEQKG